ncbi:hypothetical protein B566_EDAN010519 [Ephemera danica]|nr:hypothetical protein B566_EDAN017486 [Ephemera danica]KAF4533284.1 hypothetical protein B566_EDAN010519 [Ephemera danica]
MPASESCGEPIQLGKRSPCAPVVQKSPASCDTGNASVQRPTPRKKNTQALVKPALLPKPQLTQRHPDLVLSTKRSPVQLPSTSQPVQVSNPKIPPSVVKAPVASAAIKLDSSLRDKQEVDKVMGNTEYSSPITAQPSAIISESQAELQQTSDCTHIQDIPDVEACLVNDSSPNNIVPTQSTSNEAYQLEVHETEQKTEDEAKQVTEKLSEKWSSSEAIEDSSRLEYLSAKASLHSSLSDIMPDGLAENELEESKLSASKVTEDKGDTLNQRSDIKIVFEGLDSIGCEASFMETEDANETKDLVTNFPHSEEHINVSCQSNGSLLSMSDPRKNGEKERARSLPHLNKADVPSHGKLVLNRSVERRRRFRGDQWCDEGELSTGVLGDVDSSDAARQSSLDDVGGSDTEDSAPMMRKLRSLTNFTKNMLRKSGRKSKERKESLQSQFYCNKPSNSSEGEDTSKDSTLGDVESSTRQHPRVNEAAEEQGAQSSRENVYMPSFANADPHSESENDEEFFDSSTVQGSSDPQLSEQQKQAKKAFQIAEEIMTSERVFVDVLKLLSVDFHAFVESANKDYKTPVIVEGDLSKIFNHLPQLLQLNNELLKDLEQRISSWSKHEKIADVIVKKGPFLKLYTSYIQNFENQCTFLDECCQKNTAFAKIVQDFELSPRCKKLSLKHYMLKPVQRVPQYRLLLENYLKCLQPDSLDYADTNTALQIVCEVADHANRSMKEGDALSKLLQLQSLLGHYELIKPGRILKREGELLKVCRKGMQPRYFILLNDCLLYTTYYGSGLPSGLKVNYEIPVQQMKVIVSSTEDYSNEFSIISVTRSFTLVASSPEVMQAWVNDLQAAIQEKANKESTFLHARLASDPATSSWKLGKEAPVVCGDCSAYKAPLQYMKFRAARVCNDCFSVLQQEFKDHNFLPDGLPKQEAENALEVAKLHFNKATPTSSKKSKKYIPQRLKEVSANDAGCQISGWLQRHMRRSWKKMWFVLKDQVLYMYKASEDVVALESLPVLGYEVKLSDGQQYVGIDAKLLFMLTHKGQPQLVFHADNVNSAQRWIRALQEATTLQV